MMSLGESRQQILFEYREIGNWDSPVMEVKPTQSSRGTELVGRNRPVATEGWGAAISHMAVSVE